MLLPLSMGQVTSLQQKMDYFSCLIDPFGLTTTTTLLFDGGGGQIKHVQM